MLILLPDHPDHITHPATAIISECNPSSSWIPVHDLIVALYDPDPQLYREVEQLCMTRKGLDRGVTCSGVHQVVIPKLSIWQPANPVVLMVRYPYA